MSVKFKYVALILTFTGFAIGGWITRMKPQPNTFLSERSLASEQPKIQKYFGKQLMSVKTKVRALNFEGSTPDSEVTLEGSVHLLRAVDDGELYYKWILPEGVYVVGGIEEDSWAGVPVGSIQHPTLTVVGLDSTKMHNVILQAYGFVNGVQLGSSGVFSTQNVEVPVVQDSETQSKIHQ